MNKYVTVIKSLKAEFDRCFQDFVKVRQQIRLLAYPFTVEIAEVEKRPAWVGQNAVQFFVSRFKQLSFQEFYKSLDEALFPMLRSQSKRMSVWLNLHLRTSVFYFKFKQKQIKT